MRLKDRINKNYIRILLSLILLVFLAPYCGKQKREYNSLCRQVSHLASSVNNLKADLFSKFNTRDINTAREIARNKLAEANKRLTATKNDLEFEEQRGNAIRAASRMVIDIKKSVEKMAINTEAIESDENRIKKRIQRLPYIVAPEDFEEAIQDLKESKQVLIANCRVMINSVDSLFVAGGNTIASASWISVDDKIYFERLLNGLTNIYNEDFLNNIKRINRDTEQININGLYKEYKPDDGGIVF